MQHSHLTLFCTALQPLSNVFNQVADSSTNQKKARLRVVDFNAIDISRENLSLPAQNRPQLNALATRASPFKAIRDDPSTESRVPQIINPSAIPEARSTLSVQVNALPGESLSALTTPTPFIQRAPSACSVANIETELPDSLWCVTFDKINESVLSRQVVENIDAKMDTAFYSNSFYLESIHNYQQQLEKRLSPPANYLSNHRSITKADRANLVDALVSA